MTPIERAARALTLYVPEPIAEEAARAVIEAIREPSEAMETAGYGNSKGDPDYTGIVDNPRPDDAWRDMIDELLKE
jgi:hypothetical protein